MSEKLLCILGRSGSGKDTIANAIADKYNLRILRSYTTRPKRLGEGATHEFVTDNDYEKLKSDIVAFTEINSYKYFCTSKQIDDNDIYIIDPRGLNELKQICNKQLIALYVYVPDELRARRAVDVRHDDAEVYKKRSASEDAMFTAFESAKNYDYLVNNITYDETIKQVEQILNMEGMI